MLLPAVLAWILAGAVLVWAFGPLIVSALGLSPLRIELTEEPQMQIVPRNPAWQQRLQALASLGFRPVGTLREEAWLFERRWHWRAPLMALFATPDRRVFAALYRGADEKDVKVVFETYLSAQGRVQTVTPGDHMLQSQGNRMRQEFMLVGSVEQLLANHHEALQRFNQHRGLQVVTPTAAERTASDVEYSQRDRVLNSEPILEGLLMLGLPALLAFGVLSWEPLGVDQALQLPSAILLGGLVYVCATNPFAGWLQQPWAEDWERET